MTQLIWKNKVILDLRGESINPYWHVPFALQSLIGEIHVAIQIVSLHEPYFEHRTSGKGEHTHELGIATIETVIVAIVAERALKSLFAQTSPNDKPPRSRKHTLRDIFDKLDTSVQQAVESRFGNMPIEWEQYFEGGNVTGNDVAHILEVTNTTFNDWRYSMEPKSTPDALSMPKALLRASAAVWMVCASEILKWQHPQTTQSQMDSLCDLLPKPS